MGRASAYSKELYFTPYAFEVTCARGRPFEESGTDSVARRLRDQHGTGMCHRGNTAGHIDRSTEPVTGTADCLSRRNAGPESRQTLLHRKVQQVENCSQQQSGFRTHEHHRVADRLNEPDRTNLHFAAK